MLSAGGKGLIEPFLHVLLCSFIPSSCGIKRVADKCELLYFPVRGRGSAIRYLLKDNNIDFTDTIIQGENWGPIKPTTPFGQLPVLKDGGMDIGESLTILRYLGRKHNLYAESNLVECAKIDMMNDRTEDIRKSYTGLIYGNYDTGKEEYIAGLSQKLQPLETLMQKWNSDFISSTISWADYNFFDLLDILQILAPECLASFPKLKEYYDRIGARPGIKAYRDTDEFKNMQINGNKNK